MSKVERSAVAFAIGVGLGLVLHAVQVFYAVRIPCGTVTWPWC